MQKYVQKLKSHKQVQKFLPFVTIIALVGGLSVFSSFAATPTAQFEVESSTITGDVRTVADSTASGGSALTFGASIASLSQFRTSTVMTSYSLDSYGNATAVAAGKTLLNNSTHTAAQPIIGFGITDPIDGPSLNDFTALRKRIGDPGQNNGAIGNTTDIVLNVNGVPGWMRGRGENNFNLPGEPAKPLFIEDAPFPEFYDGVGYDVGDWVAETMVANPKIKYIQVWSEMKGFWNPTLNRWKYEEYTKMYNNIWDKVRAACTGQPCEAVKIGGPYPALTTSTLATRGYNSQVLKGTWGWADKRDMDVITYWLQNNNGADFINLDIRNHHTYDDLAQNIPALVGPFEENNKFIDTVAWIRSLNETEYPGAKTMPIWYAEWYSRWDTPDPTKSIADQTVESQGTEIQRAAIMADGLIKMVKSGAARAFLWGPQGEAGTNGWMHPLGLFTDTRVAGGGVATPFHQWQKAIHDNFAEGTALVETNSNNPKITVLASNSKLLMVNTDGTNQTTIIDGTTHGFTAHQVKLVSR